MQRCDVAVDDPVDAVRAQTRIGCRRPLLWHFAREEFANRSWVASLHVDRDHPHVHLTFARRDHDGRRFHPDRDDLFRYRQRFAQKLRDRGIEANATPARARGIDPTHEPIAARKVREKGEVPRIDKSRTDRAERLRGQGLSDPVRAFLADRQAAVRTAYEGSIAELSASPSFADQVIAKSLKRFVAAMPAPEPSSTRAMDLKDTGISPALPERDDGSVAAAIARLRKAQEEGRATTLPASSEQERSIGASERHRSFTGKVVENGDKEQPDARAARLRSRNDQASEPALSTNTSLVDEIIRQTRERERAQHERDRSRDLEGPRR